MIITSARPVHPHRCGERSFWVEIPKGFSGSSPQVWGTQSATVSAADFSRFIPTGVGNAYPAGHYRNYKTVHPHRCGERRLFLPVPHPRNGSSPQVWGTLSAQIAFAVRGRFIPTGVGNARGRKGQNVGRSVHPHRCGERT